MHALANDLDYHNNYYFRMQPQAVEFDIFHNWHVCYHGTKPGDLCSIIECGRLIKPGSYIMGLPIIFLFAIYNYTIL